MCKKNSEINIPREQITLEEISNRAIEKYGFKNEWTKVKISKYPFHEETYRTDIRRQRDKILYTGGFRRLQDKTQVMSATLTGDHRTRLTHTLEVEQIAISVADALGLNKDLVSAIALGHDVGHTPFGHAAERTLDELLKDNGGFHHPIQSIKYLWEKYGNNLINEIYEGILLHDSDMNDINTEKVREQLKYCVYWSKDEKKEIDIEEILSYINEVPSTLEAQVVVWADKIAYITHDLEDFLNSSIFSSVIKVEKEREDELCKLLNSLIRFDDETCPEIKKISEFELRNLLRKINTNLIKSSANIIKSDNFDQKNVKISTNSRKESSKENNKKKRYLDSLIINFDNEFRVNYYELRKFLDEEYISSPEVQRSDAKAQKIITSLFKELTDNYKLTPLDIRKKIDDELDIEINKCVESDLKREFDDIKDENITTKEKKLEQHKKSFEIYKEIRKKIIARNVASYISTMSDTYAENMFCNLNASKDNYSL